MGKFEKLMLKILSGNADKNIKFDDLRKLLLNLGFQERNKGSSHHVFFKAGVEEIINIQPKNGLGKAYQVKRIRQIIIKYKLSKI